MIRSAHLLVILCLGTFVFAGCVPLIVGGAVGALGGYAISRDTIQGETAADYNKLWEAARTVAKIRGAVNVEDKARGYLELEVNKNQVQIEIIRLTQATNRLKVKARTRMRLPNLKLAEELFVKILEQAS